MSLLKAIVICALILICFVIALGGGPDHHRRGFRYWQDPGAFKQYNNIEGDLGRFLGVWASIVQATFAYLGTELVGVAFGETPDPRKNVPRAVRQTLLRIVFFYVAGVISLGMAVPYNNARLISDTSKGTSGAASPFVIAAKIAGIGKLDSIINAFLLVFTVSAANSDIYLAARTIWALAKDGQAPAIFHKTNKRGVPIAAVAVSSLFIALGFMNVTKDAATVFGYFVSLVTVFGALNWISILVSYHYMLQGMKAQGIPRSVMPYRNPLLPWGAYIAFVVTVLVIIFNGFAAFMPFKVDKFITSYSKHKSFPPSRLRHRSLTDNSRNPCVRSQRLLVEDFQEDQEGSPRGDGPADGTTRWLRAKSIDHSIPSGGFRLASVVFTT